jgi:hypothetical protein
MSPLFARSQVTGPAAGPLLRLPRCAARGLSGRLSAETRPSPEPSLSSGSGAPATDASPDLARPLAPCNLVASTADVLASTATHTIPAIRPKAKHCMGNRGPRGRDQPPGVRAPRGCGSVPGRVRRPAAFATGAPPCQGMHGRLRRDRDEAEVGLEKRDVGGCEIEFILNWSG